jgi:hypothetical protein
MLKLFIFSKVSCAILAVTLNFYTISMEAYWPRKGLVETYLKWGTIKVDS